MESRFVPTGRSLALWSAFVLYSAAVLGWTHIDRSDLQGSAGTPAVGVTIPADEQPKAIGALNEKRTDGGATQVCEPGPLFPLPSLVTAKLDEWPISLPAAR